MKLLIKNGLLVTPDKTYKADILSEEGVIARIDKNISEKADEIINAEGKYVFSGGVDVHTHLNLALGDRKVSDGFYHGTVAAAFGGTTTIIDHPEAGEKDCSLHHQPDMYKKNLEKEAVIDYAVHGVFQRVDDAVLKEIPELINDGIPSMKVYCTYDNMLTYNAIEKVIDVMDSSGGLTAFHAEDDAVIKELQKKYGDEGRLEPIYHAKSRPDFSEADAIKQILKTAKGRPVYIVHLSTKKGLQVIKKAKAVGQAVIAETCPQYLLLTEERYNDPDGAKYIMAPPLRKQEDCDALWEGLADGTIDIVATDHCSFSYADKVKFGKDDFRRTPGGCPGVETRVPLLYSEGVAKGRITLERFSALISENPAKKMGLYPRKGSLAVGSDADFFIMDTDISRKISVNTLHQKCDYTPFEGYEATGWPVTAVSRGEVIVNNGRFTGKRGRGVFLPRTPSKKED